MDIRKTDVDLRTFGIEIVGEVPWGTHFCQFYHTKRDLKDILVPYFAEGLRSNEYCMWITSMPLEVKEAKAALEKAVPNVDGYLEKGQIEILPHTDWYLVGGEFDADKVLDGWVQKEKDAFSRGFAGLRLSGNTFWIERKGWKSFVDYEAKINEIIGLHKMIALCTYSLRKCTGTDVVDVVRNHAGTLIRKGENWHLVEDVAHRRTIENRRKKAEEKLQENETLLRSFFDSPGIMRGIVEVIDDVDIRHIRDNEVTARYIGLTSTDLQGKLSSELGEPPERIKVWLEHYKKSQICGQPVSFEYADKQGSKISWFIATVTYLGIPDGGHPRFAYVVVDVTERRKMEQAHLETRDYLDNLLDYANAPIIVWDREFKITMFNHAFERLTGFASSDVLGKRLDLLFPAEKKNDAMAHIQRALEGEYWEAVEIPILRKDGAVRTALWNSANIHDPANKTIIATIAQGQDITERKKAEEALRETRDYLDSLLNYANAPIIVWDPGFKITMFNRAFEHLTGLTSNEAVGKPLDILFPKEQKGEAMSYIQRTLAGEQWETVEIPILHRDGTVRTLLWNSANIHDSDSRKVIATIAQGQDITERKSLEAKLEQYTRHLELLVDEKTKQLKDSERLVTIGQTAGMVGHDIRNPLQSIEGAVYLAKEEVKSLPQQSPEKQELDEILHIIESQTRYIDHIVADLQDFARIPVPQPTETDVGALINDALVAARISKDIQIQTALQENLKLTIDPVFIRRVITNLIDNAVQAMPNGGKLNLTLTSDENKTSISVQDTGVGISENNKPKIFTPLFTTKAKGQGFGLAVCKKLIEAQGGKITFVSEAGKGTSFTMTFLNKRTN